MDDKDQDRIAHLKAMDQMIHNAKSATEKEHKMTLMQGVRLYPKAIAWSVLISTCIVMEGYDVCLINNFCRPSELNQHISLVVLLTLYKMGFPSLTGNTVSSCQAESGRSLLRGRLDSVMSGDHLPPFLGSLADLGPGR